jgi:TolB protein
MIAVPVALATLWNCDTGIGEGVHMRVLWAVMSLGILNVGAALMGCGRSSDLTEPAGRTGVILISTATTGSDLDSDGYVVGLDGESAGAIGIADTLSLAGLSPGTHSLTLESVAANCTVANDSSQIVEVAADATHHVAYAVECATLPTGIEVIVTTSGLGPDQDGYMLSLDGLAAEPVATADTIRFSDLPEGQHSFTLSGIAENCAVGTSNPFSLVVSHGMSANATMAVKCTVHGTIVFKAFVDDAVQDQGDIFAIGSDGTGLRRLTRDIPDDENPRWAPDGSRIAFWKWTTIDSATLFTMEKDGNAATPIFASNESPTPVWSPGGEKLAFVIPFFTDSVTGDYELQLHVINSDGSNHRILSHDCDHSNPTWSADGSRIAFRGKGPDYPTNTHIYIINSDGTGLQRLTDLTGYQEFPAWSPDGSTIAFANYIVEADQWDLYFVSPDGSSFMQVAHGFAPVWSPQGDRLLFTGGSFLGRDLFVIRADGSDEQNLTKRPLSGYDGAWSPDGRAVAFGAPLTKAGETHSELWVMNADGSGKTPITGFRDLGVGDASWAP